MASQSSLPLHGIRVLDFTHDWAAPHTCAVLGDWGAEVIKVEYVRRLDTMRGGNKDPQAYDRAAAFLTINRNKLSVTLDLKDPQDHASFKNLVKVSDILVSNARPGVMEKLGLGYEDLRVIRPDLIFLAMTAFGYTGPEAQYAGYGAAIEAISGALALTGYGPGERPMRLKEMDVTNGIAGAAAAMMGLLHRQLTGEGQFIDLSQTEATSSALIGEYLLGYALNGVQPPMNGNRHDRFAPQGCYRTRGADQWITLVVRSDEEWQRLCAAIGRAELASDPRFAAEGDRQRHHAEVDEILQEWTSQQDRDEAMHRLQQGGVCAGAVLDTASLMANQHLLARNYFQDAADGSGRLNGMPFRFSEGDGVVRKSGPRLGEDNVAVLCGLLGRDPKTIRPINPSEVGTAYESE